MTLVNRVKALEVISTRAEVCPLVLVTFVGGKDDDVIGLSGPEGIIERRPDEALTELERRAELAWEQIDNLSGIAILSRTYAGVCLS